MQRVLLVEDEPEIQRLVEWHLNDAGYEVVVEGNGTSALRLALVERWDLVVLDLTLPEVDGMEICRQLRARQAAGGAYAPILMLTARTAEIDRVLGLESGADDYLTKPFSVREMVARVRAILRRVEAAQLGAASGGSPPESDHLDLAFGALHIDARRRRVQLNEGDVRLTAKEFDLLRFFASHPGRVFTRAELLDKVWGYGHDGYEHTVNSHINRLRSKIEDDPATPRFVLTVWGVGYRFCEAHELLRSAS